MRVKVVVALWTAMRLSVCGMYANKRVAQSADSVAELNDLLRSVQTVFGAHSVNATVLMKLLSGLCYDLGQFAESSLWRVLFGRNPLTLSHKSKRGANNVRRQLTFTSISRQIAFQHRTGAKIILCQRQCRGRRRIITALPRCGRITLIDIFMNRSVT
jgi:hypothetical protein